MKKRIICGSAAILFTSLTLAVFASAGPGERAEVTLKSSANATSIDRGRYIVKTAGCNDCHTPGYAQSGGVTEEQQWLVGDSIGWQGPWGVTYPISLRLFVQSIEEFRARGRRPGQTLRTATWSAALSLALPLMAFAAGPLADGMSVRIASNSVERGTFTGKVRIDQRGCWMVRLDKPTKDHYTMLALMVVDRLEISRGGAWTAIDLPPVVKAQPKECLEEGAD